MTRQCDANLHGQRIPLLLLLVCMNREVEEKMLYPRTYKLLLRVGIAVAFDFMHALFFSPEGHEKEKLSQISHATPSSVLNFDTPQ